MHRRQGQDTGEVRGSADGNLLRAGHDGADDEWRVGHAQLLTLGRDGAIGAASDPRSEGAAIVVDA